MLSFISKTTPRYDSLHSVTCSLCHLLTVTLAHCATCSMCHLLAVSLAHCVTCSLCHLLTASLAHCVTCTMCHLLNVSLRSMFHSLFVSLAQCITCSQCHLFNASLDQGVIHSLYRFFLAWCALSTFETYKLWIILAFCTLRHPWPLYHINYVLASRARAFSRALKEEPKGYE